MVDSSPKRMNWTAGHSDNGFAMHLELTPLNHTAKNESVPTQLFVLYRRGLGEEPVGGGGVEEPGGRSEAGSESGTETGD